MLPIEAEVSILLAVIGATVGATSWFWRFQLEKKHEEVREFKEEIKRLKDGDAPHIAVLTQQVKQLEEALNKERSQHQQSLAEKVKLQHQLTEAKKTNEELVGQSQRNIEQLRAKLAARDKELEVQAEGLRTKDNEIKQLQDELEQEKRERHQRFRRILQAAESDNPHISFTPPIPSAVPEFKSMPERRFAIISIVNLKGGVGKTTTTAHLGVAFANKGYRVLLLDLDLQGTLTMLFIKELSIRKYTQSTNNGNAQEAKSIEAYFRKAMVSRRTRIIDYAVDPDRPEHVGIGANAGGLIRIVPATDRLAKSEMQLLIRWKLRRNRLDMHCLLRHALHQHARIVGRHYDIVLIDCPPFMSISCANALLASDYLLVPINTSVRSTERVPVLLENVNQLSMHFRQPRPNPYIFMNYTDNSIQLTAKEKQLLDDLLNQCIDQGYNPTRLDQTFIPYIRSEVSKQEFETTPLTTMLRLNAAYQKLAETIEGVMPNDCRRTAKATARTE